jgi:hypothetical protein
MKTKHTKMKYLTLNIETLTQLNDEFMELNITFCKRVKEQVIDFTNHCEHYKNTYFWHSPSRSHQRRNQEDASYLEYKEENPYLDFSMKLRFYVSISCKHIYNHKKIYINGTKTTAKAFPKLLQELDTTIEILEMLLAQ